jgi:transglutaminase-like putative cysteine protease
MGVREVSRRVVLPRMSGTLTVRVGCEFRFRADSVSPAVFQVRPYPGVAQRVLEEAWEVQPDAGGRQYNDSFGNLCRRVEMAPGEASIRYNATVEVPAEADDAAPEAPQTAWESLPADCLQFILPSRYCLPDVLSETALDLFGHLPPGWGQVQGICDWVHEHIAYTIGSSTPLTDAADVYLHRRGVCRDYAHLAISFCRALNYPARYVFGYLPLIEAEMPEEGMDFAAYMEVFLGDRWYTFDPRNNARRKGRVLIGRGRDAVDVAMVTTAGAPRLLSMTVWADA